MPRILVLLGALLPASSGAAPQSLVADLSNSEISISTGFAGTELLLFGAMDREGDVVIVVRGPARDEIVRRKARVAGIWVNRDSVTFENVPAYYWVAATRELETLASPETLAAREIGAQRLRLAARGAADGESRVFREAYLRNKARMGLYGGGASVRVVGARLFRTTVRFPATVPTGNYGVTVHLLHDGVIAATRTANLTIRKSGLEAGIYNFAHDRSALYGIMCIVIALAAGWLAGVVFRRS